MQYKKIVIIGAHEHNLKSLNVEIPRNTFTVITGISGSGKSSLAFDTIYAEGQRRYIESLSSYARQFLDQLPRPHVELIEGLSPAISIEQRTISYNPRSTVGTVTEIYDYLRLLFAHLGTPHCPSCGASIGRRSLDEIVEQIFAFPEGTPLLILAPIVRGRKGEYSRLFEQLEREGFTRVVVDGSMFEFGQPIKLKKTYKHDISLVVDRLVLDERIRDRISESVGIALKKASGVVEVSILASRGDAEVSEKLVFSELYSCLTCGITIEDLSPRLFSFNSPYGACPECKGLGTILEIDPSLVTNPEKSIREGALLPWQGAYSPETTGRLKRISRLLSAVAESHGIDLDKPYKRLSKAKQHILLYGTGDEHYLLTFRRRGRFYRERERFEGVIPYAKNRYEQSLSSSAQDEIKSYYAETPCPRCGGQRLKSESLAVTFKGRTIMDLARMSIDDLASFFSEISLSRRDIQIGEQIIKEISERLRFLEDVGLGYLTLDRRTSTLAGGEAQRTRLATQIGTHLVGVLYILDEPSIGLHQRDNRRLLDTLEHLKKLGNTIIVVEHDEATIRTADYVIDLGPGAGRLGGNLVIAGAPTQIAQHHESITGRYLSGRASIPIPETRRQPIDGQSIIIKGASEHNLKEIDVVIPLGLFVCVTGVSGSGKSTLILDVLNNALMRHLYASGPLPGKHRGLDGISKIDKVINVDQSPIGRTPRSNPATYTGVLTPIRDVFALLPEARIRGYDKSRFSFNVPGGRCERCQGQGMLKIEMQFLPPVHIECPECKGARFNAQTLEVTYKDKSIADVLAMTVEEALELFSAVPQIRSKIEILKDIGLGYITLGQAATTLSGGEAQRIKLSRELVKKQTGRTLYILDEPTTGLHFEDVKRLLDVLNRLVTNGNTVVVIEHNLDIIKSADWLIDLGPEGGDAGGYVVGFGSPETIRNHATSYTGHFLKQILHEH